LEYYLIDANTEIEIKTIINGYVSNTQKTIEIDD